MMELYEFLIREKQSMAALLLQRIPREVDGYRKIPRHVLQESYDRIFEAFIDMIINQNLTPMKTVFSYTARQRIHQGIVLSATLKAIGSALPILRHSLQAGLTETAYSHVEQSMLTCVTLYAEAYVEQLEKRSAETEKASQITPNYQADAARYVILRG